MGEEGTGRKKWTELTGLGRDPWRRLWGRRAITIPLSEWLWAEWAKVNAFLEDTKGKEVC